ncbi:MAG: hypothetical protein KDA41_16405, partial [Planctomycetales bacterium]|nr:hypothetical protein [Planctomycetales bacterium]
MITTKQHAASLVVAVAAGAMLTAWHDQATAQTVDDSTAQSAAAIDYSADLICDPPTAQPVGPAPHELELLTKIRQEIGSPVESSIFADSGQTDSLEFSPPSDAAPSAENFGESYRRVATGGAPLLLTPHREAAWSPAPIDDLTVFVESLRRAARDLDAASAEL